MQSVMTKTFSVYMRISHFSEKVKKKKREKVTESSLGGLYSTNKSIVSDSIKQCKDHATKMVLIH